MKKFVVVLFLLFASTFILAQESKWTVSILPGYQLNSQSKTKSYSWEYEIAETKKGMVSSVDLNYKITEHYGLHLAYFHSDSKFDLSYYRYYNDYTWGPYRYENPVSAWEIGPEWQFKVWEKGELYLQLNFGRTFSSTDETHWSDYYDQYISYRVRSNKWTLGTAFGLRYFFIPNAGAAVQIAYHHFDGWEYSSLWDARAGVVFRF